MANFPDYKGSASGTQQIERRIALVDLAGNYAKGDVVELVKTVSADGTTTYSKARNLTQNLSLATMPALSDLSIETNLQFNAGREVLAVGTASVGLASVPAKANRATIQVEATESDIRYNTEGTAPTATSGKAADAGDVITLDSREQILGFRAICLTGTSAKLDVSYELSVQID